MTKRVVVYQQRWPGGWTEITEAKSGFVVEVTSCVTGTVTGARYLLAYGHNGAPAKGANMDGDYNDYTSVGSHLCHIAPMGRVLRKGHEVQ